LIQLKQENRELAAHLKTIVELTSKEEKSEALYKHQLSKVEQQLIQSAREKFELITRIN